jgi:hypothetical protein
VCIFSRELSRNLVQILPVAVHDWISSHHSGFPKEKSDSATIQTFLTRGIKALELEVQSLLLSNNTNEHARISISHSSSAVLCFDFFSFHVQAVVNKVDAKFLRHSLSQLRQELLPIPARMCVTTRDNKLRRGKYFC